MSEIFKVHPVGWPGAAAFVLGMLVFFATVIMARLRAGKNPKVPNAGKASITWLWIVVQGMGIGAVGMGRVDILTTPPTPAMFARGLIVLALMLCAVWLFDSSSRTMGRNWSLVARTRSDHSLVQTGPFALVRHPIYTGLIVGVVAMAVLQARPLAFVGAALFAFGFILKARLEERFLAGELPDYGDYRKQVRMIVPFVI